MYLLDIKTTATQALRATFDDNFPDEDFRNLRIGMEYPVKAQDYPSIWVDFDPVGTLTVAMIGADEYSPRTDGGFDTLYRWNAAGSLSFTVVALTSLERDRLFDAVASVLAFSRVEGLDTFRSTLETGPRIAVRANWDQIDQRGFSASPGTPWNTDEIIYEATLALDVQADFVMNADRVIQPLTGVVVEEWEFHLGDPFPGDEWIQQVSETPADQPS